MRGSAPTDINELNNWAGPSDVHCLTAGAAGYISQNFKKLGNDIHLVSCLGDDPFGVMILNSLEKIGIDPQYIQIEKGKLGAIGIFILLFENKKRPFTFRLPTHHGWPPKFDKKTKKHLLDVDLFHSAGYLHFSDLWNTEILDLFKEAKKRGIKTSIDPQFPLIDLKPPWIKMMESLIQYIDIIMVDENEALNLTGKNNVEDAAEELFAAGFKIIAIKQGAKGVLVKNSTEKQQIPAIPPKKFIDSIGAGDSFDAGFLQGLLEEKDLIIATKMGVTAATMSIEGTGGTETFPERKDLKF